MIKEMIMNKLEIKELVVRVFDEYKNGIFRDFDAYAKDENSELKELEALTNEITEKLCQEIDMKIELEDNDSYLKNGDYDEIIGRLIVQTWLLHLREELVIYNREAINMVVEKIAEKLLLDASSIGTQNEFAEVGAINSSGTFEVLHQQLEDPQKFTLQAQINWIAIKSLFILNKEYIKYTGTEYRLRVNKYSLEKYFRLAWSAARFKEFLNMLEGISNVSISATRYVLDKSYYDESFGDKRSPGYQNKVDILTSKLVHDEIKVKEKYRRKGNLMSFKDYKKNGSIFVDITLPDFVLMDFNNINDRIDSKILKFANRNKKVIAIAMEIAKIIDSEDNENRKRKNLTYAMVMDWLRIRDEYESSTYKTCRLERLQGDIKEAFKYIHGLDLEKSDALAGGVKSIDDNLIKIYWK